MDSKPIKGSTQSRPDHKWRYNMISRQNTISKLLAAVGMTAILAVGAVTPSSAATSHLDYHARAYDSRAYDSRGDDALPRSVARQRSGGGHVPNEAPAQHPRLPR